MPSGSTTAKPGYRSPYPSSELSEVEDFLTSGEDEHDRLPLSGKFPVEVLTLILDHLSFPDLYGSAQYVDKSWHYVATNLILGNHSFLERILDTDFDRLFQTCAGTLEDNYRSRNNAITLHNIGINAGELLSGQDAETWTGKSNKSLGLYLNQFYRLPGLPYMLEAQAVSEQDQEYLDDDEYNQLRFYALGGRRSVWIEMTEWNSTSGDAHFNIHDCLRAIYWQYKTMKQEFNRLVDFLQADLWTPWVKQNERRWGKKRAGLHKQGRLIDLVNALNADREAMYPDLNQLLQQWDLLHRRITVFQTTSLHNISRYSRRDLNFDGSYRSLLPSWTDPSPRRINTRHAECFITSTIHNAKFMKTIDLMTQHFSWHHSILSAAEYDNLKSVWAPRYSSKVVMSYYT